MKKDYIYPTLFISLIFVFYYVLVYFWFAITPFEGNSNLYTSLYFVNLLIFLSPVSICAFRSVLWVLKIYISCNPYNIKNIYELFWCLEVFDFEDNYDLKNNNINTYNFIDETNLLINHLKKNRKEGISEDFYVLEV